MFEVDVKNVMEQNIMVEWNGEERPAWGFLLDGDQMRREKMFVSINFHVGVSPHENCVWVFVKFGSVNSLAHICCFLHLM